MQIWKLLLGAAAVACLGSATCPPKPYACSKPFEKTGPIALDWPRARAVYQQRGGTGDIRVAGQVVDIAPGAVLARYRNGPWRRIDVDPVTGAFDADLVAQPIGWGAVEVALERDPAVHATVTPVGVGNVIVLAGQSNMVMTLSTPIFTRRGVTVLGRRRNPADPQAILFAGDPMHDCTDTTGSIWPYFGDRVIAATGAPVMFVATAVGGTGLVSTGEWLPGGVRFQAMLDQIRTATAERMCAAALLWLQGESDAIVGVSRESYRDGLLAFAAALEGAMQCELPIVAGSIGNIEAATGVDANAIRSGTFDAIDASPDLFAGPWTQDLPMDYVHFTDDAAQPLLDRWCASVDAAPIGLACE